jgi:DNA-binding LacI/PurR family transcriptional regulator
LSMKSKQQPTLRDVAREAGVSYQTVSRVINNHPNVSPTTRSRILKVIHALGYRPNRAAQILQTKRSNTLEVVTPYFGFNHVLYDMAWAARQLGYHFTISAITTDELDDTLLSAASRFVDGLILIPLYRIVEDYDELMRLTHGIPFVQIGARVGANLPSVICDQAQGARLATQHLIDLGHRQIAEISGPLLNYDAYDRHEGWLATMADNGLESGLSVEGDFTIDGGYQAMCRLLDRGEEFTAVFIGNDSMAVGAQTALRSHGLRVPDDVSLVGFDDIPEAAHRMPALTTIRQDFQLLGRLAVEYIVSMIGDPDTPVYQRVLPLKLIIRESTRSIVQPLNIHSTTPRVSNP